MKMLEQFANNFFDAFYQKKWLSEHTASMATLSLAEAYQVQDLVAQKRIAAGEAVVGYKVGCTSTAIRSQFGLTEPINGRLFQPHIFNANAQLDWSDFLHCAIEPEMVLKIGKDLRGENLSDDELIDAIECISPGIEIHNFHFWHTPPTSQELICSGGLLAGLVVGNTRVAPCDLSFQHELFSVYKNKTLITSAPASEIMGGPLHSLRWLVKVLTAKGCSLKESSLVIPGSPVELVPIDQDTDLKISIDCVGSLATAFKRRKSDNIDPLIL